MPLGARSGPAADFVSGFKDSRCVHGPRAQALPVGRRRRVRQNPAVRRVHWPLAEIPALLPQLHLRPLLSARALWLFLRALHVLPHAPVHRRPGARTAVWLCHMLACDLCALPAVGSPKPCSMWVGPQAPVLGPSCRPQVIFNSRRSANATDNQQLYDMDMSRGPELFEADLTARAEPQLCRALWAPVLRVSKVQRTQSLALWHQLHCGSRCIRAVT
jgi:hypothetical protein